MPLYIYSGSTDDRFIVCTVYIWSPRDANANERHTTVCEFERTSVCKTIVSRGVLVKSAWIGFCNVVHADVSERVK